MIPIGFREIPAEGLDKDFVFVELEHDVGKPPMLFTLHAVAVARRAPRGWRGVEGFLDHIGNCDARWECKATSYSNQAVSQGALAAETRRSQANCEILTREYADGQGSRAEVAVCAIWGLRGD